MEMEMEILIHIHVSDFTSTNLSSLIKVASLKKSCRNLIYRFFSCLLFMFSLSNKYHGDKYETFDAATRADDAIVDRKNVFEWERWHEWKSSHDTQEL